MPLVKRSHRTIGDTDLNLISFEVIGGEDFDFSTALALELQNQLSQID